MEHENSNRDLETDQNTGQNTGVNTDNDMNTEQNNRRNNSTNQSSNDNILSHYYNNYNFNTNPYNFFSENTNEDVLNIDSQDDFENINILEDMFQNEEIERLREEVANLQRLLSSNRNYNISNNPNLTYMPNPVGVPYISDEEIAQYVENHSPSSVTEKNNHNGFMFLDKEKYEKLTGLNDFDVLYNTCKQTVNKNLEEYNNNNLGNIIN